MGLRGRLLLAFLIPTLLVMAVGGFVLYRASRLALEDELGRSLADLAAGMSAQLRAERVLALEADDAQGEGSRTYRALTTQLQEFTQRTGLRRVFVVDAERRVRIDVGGGLPPMSEATELLRDTLEVSRVMKGERASSLVLFEGTDHRLYKTGYAPLLQDGNVVGVVAVEGSAAFFGPLTGLRDAFLGLAGLTLLSVAVVALIIAGGLAGPIERLAAAALRIGAGDLETQVTPEARGELGVLARELEAMRRAIEGRDRQLKMMLGGVAHEVKNPLGGMSLFTGLLDEELASATPNVTEARAHLEKIRRELAYLTRIVEDFLAFAREQRVQRTAFEASAWLERSIGHLAGEAEGRGVKLELEAQPATLQGDQSLLTSALVNLIKNAVQISAREQRVVVAARLEGANYTVEVRDEGPGVPVDKQERIFEPFFTTREQGTGLGLPLARKVVEAHRGTLTLSSKPGATVFRLSLPLE